MTVGIDWTQASEGYHYWLEMTGCSRGQALKLLEDWE